MISTIARGRIAARRVARGLLMLTFCLPYVARARPDESAFAIEWRRVVNERLREIMPARSTLSRTGVSATSLANVLGISRPLASLKLLGYTYLNLEDASKIEAKYGVPVAHILAADVLRGFDTLSALKLTIQPLTSGMREMMVELYLAPERASPPSSAPPISFVAEWRRVVIERLAEILPAQAAARKYSVSTRDLAATIGRSQSHANLIVKNVYYLRPEHVRLIAAKHGRTAEHYLAVDLLRARFDRVEDLRFAIAYEPSATLRQFLEDLYRGSSAEGCGLGLEPKDLNPR